MCNSTLATTELKAPGEQLFAWIEVDGKKMEVYGVKTEGNVVTCFIESKVGSEFSLCYRLGMSAPKYDIRATGKVDGSKFGSWVHRTWSSLFESVADSPERVRRLDGTQISTAEQKKLVFTPIEFTDDHKLACSNPAILSALGSITLTVQHGSISHNRVSDPTFHEGPSDQKPIFSGLKGGLDMTERAKHGRTEQTDEASYFKFTPLCGYGDKSTVCEFHFLYRSHDILENMGLIEYEPLIDPAPNADSTGSDSFTLVSPPASPLESTFSELSLGTSRSSLDDEIRAQRRLIRAERDKLRQLEGARSTANTPVASTSS